MVRIKSNEMIEKLPSFTSEELREANQVDIGLVGVMALSIKINELIDAHNALEERVNKEMK